MHRNATVRRAVVCLFIFAAACGHGDEGRAPGATSPSEPRPAARAAASINGFLVSGRFTVHPFERAEDSASSRSPAGKTFPPELYASLRDTIVDTAAIRDEDLAAVYGAPPAAAKDDASDRQELRVIE